MQATEGRPALSVVVPVFRNAAYLPELSERLAGSLSGLPYELLFIDDASPDDARRVVRELARLDARVCGLVLAENVGQNAAVVAGLAHARAQVTVVMDGDLQDPPEAVPVLVQELEARRLDAVFAGRRGRYESQARLTASRLFKRALWALTAGQLPPDAGLFVAIRRHVAEKVVASASADPYVVVLIARAASRVGTVPVKRAPGSESSYTGRMRFGVARRGFATAVRRAPAAPHHRVIERIGRRFGVPESA